MSDRTGIEDREIREALESGAAHLLGNMLFEWGRLEMALGLCLVWVNGGRDIEKLTPKIEQESFALKIERLQKIVLMQAPAHSTMRAAYGEWIDRSQRLRLNRNNLVHSRWGVDHIRGKVISVAGLPTSPSQQVIEYTLPDLEEILAEMKRLHSSISELCHKWPL